jgi:hypothetical protein
MQHPVAERGDLGTGQLGGVGESDEFVLGIGQNRPICTESGQISQLAQ